MVYPVGDTKDFYPYNFIIYNNYPTRVTGKPGTPEQPGSAGTALFLRILSHALLLALYTTTI